MNKLFYCSAHQHKANAYILALQKAGWTLVPRIDTADFVLLDHDVGRDGVGWRKEIEEAERYNKPLIMYPHAARPMLQWDGMYPLYPKTRVNLVHAVGHKRVMEMYGYPLPIEVMGWSYCEIKNFVQSRAIRNVLFAPIHPNASQYLCKEDLELNKKAYEALLKIPNIHIILRMMGTYQNNGLWREPKVALVRGRPDGSYIDIDRADVVVAAGTYQYISVARGKPTLGFGEDITPHSGNKPDNLRWVKSWDKYKDYMMYPLDLLKFDDPLEALQTANCYNKIVEEWKKDFIGVPFSERKLITTIERYIK